MRTVSLFAPVALLGAVAAGLAAQRPPTAAARPAVQGCPDGTPAVGDLGYTRLSCSCTLSFDPAAPERKRWQFNSEPRIEAIRPGGPAEGKLKAGDVVVAIDGQLITTREAGRRFAQVTPGEPVTLTIRRDGRELTVEIVPDVDCPTVDVSSSGVEVTPAPAPPARPARPAPPSRAPRVVAVPAPPQAGAPPAPPPQSLLPEGWFGLSIRCSDCGISRSERDSTSVWKFSSPPTVESVEPGSPADKAGIREGDHITHLDGRAITTPEAGARFGAVQPGQRVTFGIQRDGETRDVAITAGERIAHPAPAPTPRPERIVRPQPRPGAQRFSGVIGDALVEVTGGPITVQRTEDEIVIRSADITVRIKRTDKTEQ
jgi:membrane-associated protease RseP (regulator of RpoE activity)